LTVASWAADLTNLLLPAGCVSCGSWVPQREADALVCFRCRAGQRASSWPRCQRCHYPRGTGRSADSGCRACAEWDPALTSARHAFTLESPTDDLVHALKYEGWAELAPVMAAAMARLELPGLDEARPVVVTAIPATSAKIRSRGYNQAGLLASHVGRLESLPVVTLLRRTRGGPSQTSLHPSERRANVAGAFAATDAFSDRWKGAHVVLVDDVLTTGATASSAAVALGHAGASLVTLVTYARAITGERPDAT